MEYIEGVIYTHTHTHIHAHTQVHTHIHTCTHSHTCEYMEGVIHTHAHTHISTHKHAHTRTHTHARMHTNTHMCTCKHSHLMVASKEQLRRWLASRENSTLVTPLEWAGSNRLKHCPVDTFHTLHVTVMGEGGEGVRVEV